MDIKENGYTNCYVAFLDIWGFSAYIEELTEKGQDNGFSVLKELFVDLDKLAQHITTKSKSFPPETLNGLNYYIMSDSIIAAIPVDVDYSLEFLVDFSNEISIFILTRYGLLTRGGIANGLIYINDKVVFGKALIDAYRLESKMAIYPRIVLSPKAVKKYIDYIIKYNGEDDLKAICQTVKPCDKVNLYETSPLELFFSGLCDPKVKSKKDLYSDVKNYLFLISNALNEKTKKFADVNNDVKEKTIYYINYYNFLIKKYNVDLKEIVINDENVKKENENLNYIN